MKFGGVDLVVGEVGGGGGAREEVGPEGQGIRFPSTTLRMRGLVGAMRKRG